MFANKTNENTCTQLQQALDHESVRTQSQEVGLDAPATAFRAEIDPTAPIFRRATARPRTFQADLFNGMRA